MIVDCMTCPVRGQRCDGCVVTMLLAPGWAELAPPNEVTSSNEVTSADATSPDALMLDATEERAVSMFVGAGLVKAEATLGLHAQREAVEHWGLVRSVG